MNLRFNKSYIFLILSSFAVFETSLIASQPNGAPASTAQPTPPPPAAPSASGSSMGQNILVGTAISLAAYYSVAGINCAYNSAYNWYYKIESPQEKDARIREMQKRMLLNDESAAIQINEEIRRKAYEDGILSEEENRKLAQKHLDLINSNNKRREQYNLKEQLRDQQKPPQKLKDMVAAAA